MLDNLSLDNLLLDSLLLDSLLLDSLLLDSLFEMIVAQLWQVTILCVVVGWLSRCLLRRNPVWSYYLWLLVLVKSVTPPVWASRCGVFSWLFQRLSDVSAGWIQGVMGPEWSNASLTTAMLSVWAIGFVCSLVLTLVRFSRLQYRVENSRIEPTRELHQFLQTLRQRLSIRRPVALALTSEPLGPAIVGLHRPVLVLPQEIVADKSLPQLEPILVHELLHVRRGDTFVALLETIVRSVWWFHPQVVRAADHASQAGELCCDQDVLHELHCEPRSYADTLLGVLVAKCRLQPLLGRPGIRGNQVTRERLFRIMTWQPGKKRILLQLLLFLLSLLIVLPGSRAPDPTAASTPSVPRDARFLTLP